MPELSIDGRKVEVPPGTNLIEAARKLSIEVPYYCYHPALSTVGSCRMCQIEIHEPGKPPRVTIACRTEATQGLNVSTTGKDCLGARAAALEFLLANHPLDCPICDKAGECDLQNFSYRHGNGTGRFSEPKRQLHKREPIGDHILLDQERCILCTRCVRFMGEYAKSPSLVVAGRGDKNVIATFPGEPIQSNYEGNLADVCPVGALTLKEFHHKSRVWDLRATSSVCTLCDRNCSIVAETKRNHLLRVRPRVNLQVNGHFMCDVGRFGMLDLCNPVGREEMGWSKGERKEPGAVAEELAAALGSEKGRWVVVLSPRLTTEELLLARTVLAPLAKALVHVPVAAVGGDTILYTGRRAANLKALELLGIAAKSEAELAALASEPTTAGVLCFDAITAQQLVAKAKPKRLALIDVWSDQPAPAGGPPPPVIGPGTQPSPGSTATSAPLGCELYLPGTLPTEKDGTFVNLTGVMQASERAQRPPHGVLGEVGVLQVIAARAGIATTALTSKPDLTFAALEALGRPGLTLRQLPETGLALLAAQAATA